MGDDTPHAERRWHVVYTRSRQEKALARHLVAHETPFYLPLVKQSRMQRGKRVNSFNPLFTGYLFLFGTPEERVTALKSNRISQVLDVEDAEQLRSDLCRVRRLIATDTPLTVEQCLAPGQQVRIKSGSLEGVEGTIISRRGTDRLLIAVTYLNQGVSVQIDDFQVEPI